MQKSNERLFVLLFLYKRYIKIKRPMSENEIAVYGIDLIVSFIINAKKNLYIIIFFYIKKVHSPKNEKVHSREEKGRIKRNERLRSVTRDAPCRRLKRPSGADSWTLRVLAALTVGS